jgi:Sigma-70 region 2
MGNCPPGSVKQINRHEAEQMAGKSRASDFLNQLNLLYQVGVIGNLSDEQLLQQFITAPDEASQASFTVLVVRHGPMVFHVCRQILGDSDDAQGAFQTTFLRLLIDGQGAVLGLGQAAAEAIDGIGFECHHFPRRRRAYRNNVV